MAIDTKNNNKRTLDKLLILFGTAISFTVLFSFGIYRLTLGDIDLAVTDGIVSSILLLLFIQTWRRKRTDHINLLLVITYMSAIFTVIFLKGMELFYWTYPAIAATFILLNVRIAVSMNIMLIFASMIILLPQIALSEFINIYATLILLCVFGYIFSARTEFQKNQLSLLATQDSLTMIGNRRSLDQRISEEVEIFKRTSQPTTILILDLDHFKKVNDTYSHSIGDEVLIDLVNILKSSTRVTDRIYRYGGEEFVIITNNTTLEDAGRVAEYLRELVEENLKVGDDHSLTISIGVAEITKDDSEDSWLHRADLALYEAKNASRNIVYLASKNIIDQTYSYRPYQRKTQTIYKKRKIKDVISIHAYRDRAAS